ncbi:MAG: dihydroorotase, homodimeric type, partial [uncultured bacterium]
MENGFTDKDSPRNILGEESMSKKIRIKKGFDAHVHLRRGGMMADVLPFTAKQFAGGVTMGNLPGGDVLDTLEKNLAYLGRVKALEPSFNAVVPLMVTRELLERANVVRPAIRGGVRVFKFIPGGLTTNGADGLTLYDLYSYSFTKLLKELEEQSVVFSCHFEVGTSRVFNDSPVPMFWQEQEAIRFLQYLLEKYPKLKIVVEHASSCAMIDFIEKVSERYQIAATLTPHHAMVNYWDVCNPDGEIFDPLKYCKPVAKQEQDIKAVKLAMCSGNPRFFAGTDSAPHLYEVKLSQ